MADDDDILRVNAAYDPAFATADFTAMSRIWAMDRNSMHPPRMAGAVRAAVLDSWKASSAIPGSEEIEFHEATAIVDGDQGRGAGALRRLLDDIRGVELVSPQHPRPLADDPPPGLVAPCTPDRGEQDSGKPQRLN